MKLGKLSLLLLFLCYSCQEKINIEIVPHSEGYFNSSWNTVYIDGKQSTKEIKYLNAIDPQITGSFFYRDSDSKKTHRYNLLSAIDCTECDPQAYYFAMTFDDSDSIDLMENIHQNPISTVHMLFESDLSHGIPIYLENYRKYYSDIYKTEEDFIAALNENDSRYLLINHLNEKRYDKSTYDKSDYEVQRIVKMMMKEVKLSEQELFDSIKTKRFDIYVGEIFPNYFGIALYTEESNYFEDYTFYYSQNTYLQKIVGKNKLEFAEYDYYYREEDVKRQHKNKKCWKLGDKIKVVFNPVPDLLNK